MILLEYEHLKTRQKDIDGRKPIYRSSAVEGFGLIFDKQRSLNVAVPPSHQRNPSIRATLPQSVRLRALQLLACCQPTPNAAVLFECRWAVVSYWSLRHTDRPALFSFGACQKVFQALPRWDARCVLGEPSLLLVASDVL